MVMFIWAATAEHTAAMEMDLSSVRSKSKATIATENIVRCALDCIKTKAAETELSFHRTQPK